jgi:hypothetical protein
VGEVRVPVRSSDERRGEQYERERSVPQDNDTLFTERWAGMHVLVALMPHVAFHVVARLADEQVGSTAR